MLFEEFRQRLVTEVQAPTDKAQSILQDAEMSIVQAFEGTRQLADGSESPQLAEAVAQYRCALEALGEAAAVLAEVRQPLEKIMEGPSSRLPSPVLQPAFVAQEAAPETPPAYRLIKAAGLQAILHVGRSYATKFNEHMVGVKLGDTTYRFSPVYANAYVEWLAGEKPTVSSAKEFARTPEASKAAHSAEFIFTQELSGMAMKGNVSLPDIMDAFNVGRQTVFDWRDEGFLESSYWTYDGRRNLYFSLESFLNFCQWVKPEDLKE